MFENFLNYLNYLIKFNLNYKNNFEKKKKLNLIKLMSQYYLK